MIKAEKLSFGFPGRELYHQISFALEEGSHCALIGRNGVGKTVLAKLIRRPEDFLYDGKFQREHVGRVGWVGQFVSREADRDPTVLEYLSEDFLRLQEETEAVCTQMASAEELDALLERYQQLLDEAQSMDADNYLQNIRRQLQLAELEGKEGLQLSKLSGGEYKLVQMIRQLLCRPGLLIMDEPDVYLDFENLNGLRELINAYAGTLLVITHSRYLLAHCFDRIWHLENADLQEFDGGFPEYQYALLQKKIELQRAADADAAEIRRAEEMVERLRKEATEVIDPLRGRTLKGKVSYLGRLLARQIKAPFVEIRQPEIMLPAVERMPEQEVLLQVTDYSLEFEDKLLEHVSFCIHANEKVALVGPNGTGKSTMLRELWKGEHPAVHFSEQAIVGFFSQLQEGTLQKGNTIYQEFYELGLNTPGAVEEHLQRYCFERDVLDRTTEQLSGGERNLLQLAKLAVGRANLLLLDEPSSHLDTYAQMALERAILAYEGAILMVSHDFFTIANCADRILYVENKTIRPMSGRAFRKMVYKHHFRPDYLQLEQRKKELEARISRSLEEGDLESAQLLCDELSTVVEQMRC